MSPHSSTMKRRIAGLRTRIRVPFSIRGTTRQFLFSSRGLIRPAPRGSSEIPTYHISPRYRMGSKEWIKRLHATVHAAVARAMSHSSDRWNRTPISSKNMPSLMVFLPVLLFRKNKQASVKMVYDEEKGIIRALEKPGFNIKYAPRREVYEYGIVHGINHPTFKESFLQGIHLAKGFRPDDKKAFHVALTQHEYHQAIARINRKLRLHGYASIEDFKSRLPKNEDEWRSIFDVSPRRRIEFNQETAIHNPVKFLLYEEITRILTNKLVRKGMKVLDQLNPPRPRKKPVRTVEKAPMH